MCINTISEYVRVFGKDSDPDGILTAIFEQNSEEQLLAVELAARGLRRGKPFSRAHLRYMFRDMTKRKKENVKNGLVY